VYKQVPKGYLRAEHPLPHNLKFDFQMGMETGVPNQATYLPLIMNDEALVNADAVNANPRHASFAEADHSYCHHDSIIPKMMVSFKAKMTKGAIVTDEVRHIVFNWMPVYTSFLNRLEAEDSKTAVQIEDILELTHETVGKSVVPTWSGSNITGDNIELHATPTTALMGLTTNAIPESVIFDKDQFYDALQFMTNAPMLRKVIGRMHTVHLTRDRIYSFYSSNFTNPMVKRINDYTFCGILVQIPQAGTPDQMILAADTTAIDHVAFAAQVRYDEWNSEFDQTTS